MPTTITKFRQDILREIILDPPGCNCCGSETSHYIDEWTEDYTPLPIAERASPSSFSWYATWSSDFNLIPDSDPTMTFRLHPNAVRFRKALATVLPKHALAVLTGATTDSNHTAPSPFTFRHTGQVDQV